MHTGSLTIVYVGPLSEGGTCRMRMEALTDLGHIVLPINSEMKCPTYWQRLVRRSLRNLGVAWDAVGANQAILKVFAERSADVLWIDKGLTISRDILITLQRRVPKPCVISYSPDDMYGGHNQSRQYLSAITYYDLHVTTKSYNVAELGLLGARSVLFVNNAYHPSIHRPISVSLREKRLFGGAVGFIGAYEQGRAADLCAIARAGVHVRVWGWGWNRLVSTSTLRVENKPVWGDNYSKAISAFDINLCFLRKVNRDLQTQRSVEIPACGAFMLAERTDEHLALFEEGKEAEYFGSQQELLEKITFYLNHETLRRRIALAGRERCVRSRYDNQTMVSKVLDAAAALR
jgi:hypothetical protein